MARKLKPADLVIELFGIRPLATDLKCSPTTILRWRNSPTLAGEIPGQWHKPILALAKARKTPLTADDLLYGRAA